jgi:hypothetical protein
MPSDFTHVKVGDKVVRMLAGKIRMELTVTAVEETKIVCGWWDFDRATGAEIDEDLGWGPPPLITGSFLVHEEKVDG